MPQQCSLSRQSRGLALTGQDEQPLPDPSGESLDGRHMVLQLLLDHNGSWRAANSMKSAGYHKQHHGCQRLVMQLRPALAAESA